MTDDAWAGYLEALRALRRAPELAHARREQIDAEAARSIRAAEESLRATVARRETLEAKVTAVADLLRIELTGGPAAPLPVASPVASPHASPVASPVALPFALPSPTTIDEALDAVDRIERMVRDDLARLDAVPPPAEPRRPRRWRYAVLAGALVLAVIVVSALLL